MGILVLIQGFDFHFSVGMSPLSLYHLLEAGLVIPLVMVMENSYTGRVSNRQNS
jgi:hypothetical protein